jgi:hypothetical protein
MQGVCRGQAHCLRGDWALIEGYSGGRSGAKQGSLLRGPEATLNGKWQMADGAWARALTICAGCGDFDG